MILIRPYSCFLLFFLVSGCVPQLPQNNTFVEETAQAKMLEAQGNHKEAGELYQNLAQINPDQQNNYYLSAAESFLQSGDYQHAQDNIEKMDRQFISIDQQHRLELIQARLDLSYGNAESALSRLERLQAVRFNEENRKHYYQAKAFAFALTGQLLDSAQVRIRLAEFLIDQEEIAANNQAILETLMLLPLSSLQNPKAPAPNVLSGWMSLASIAKRYSADEHRLTREFDVWRRKYPVHPGNYDGLLQHVDVQAPIEAILLPRNIAVLLPESGPLTHAALAIKAGIMVAYEQSSDEVRPALTFYDSFDRDPAFLYQQAVTMGAELVLGPLDKQNIIALANSLELEVPVIALNHVEQLSKTNLYQFGLSPIDEVYQITLKAKLDGHHNALFLLPEGSKGERINHYLTETWAGESGYDRVLDTQFYNQENLDFSKSIKALLKLEESEQRHQKLLRLLNLNLEFVPRRRQDVDAIFISAYPTTARSLNPQLKFYYATDIPIYALPTVYSGQQNPDRDKDLEQITFCDIPWLFPGEYPGYLSREGLQDLISQFALRYHRLIAMGIDAYQLVTFLSTTPDAKFQGATGLLTVDVDRRIKRELVCAKFTDGVPVVSGYLGHSTDINNHQEDFSDQTDEHIDFQQEMRPIFYESR